MQVCGACSCVRVPHCCVYVHVSSNETSRTYEPGHEKTYLPYANNKGADQPAHPRSLISIFVVRFLDSIIAVVAMH